MTAEHRGQTMTSGESQVLPRLVIDPGLDAALRRRLQHAEPSALRQAESAQDPSPWRALLAPLSTRLGTGLLLCSGYLLFVPDTRQYADLMLEELFKGFGAPATLMTWTIAPSLLAAWSLSKVFHSYQQRREIRQLRAARAHYVITDGLGERARTLIARVDHTLHTARQAVKCEDDSVGRAHVDELGREPWEIAVSLRDLIEFTATTSPDQPHPLRSDDPRDRGDAESRLTGAAGSAVQPSRKQVLEEVWEAIEHRVGALVAACEEVVALNAEFRAFLKSVEADPENGPLLDLRASATRHTLAKADLEALRANLAAARRALAADGGPVHAEPAHEQRAGLDGAN
ncbi:hypothetical protein ACFV4X_12775 [Streptomyces ardesiacus]|uniref:hypothetical protein n=1 Tax=Streptomyces ardesiacus TaxID=285564 RepID=UPI00365FA053